MVGMLAAQGLIVGLCFSIPPALSGGAISVAGLGLALGRAILSVIFLMTPAFVLARRIVPSVLRYLSDRGESGDELFFLGVVALALIMSLFTEYLGLSLDLGAFFAGLIIADTPFMVRAQETVKPLASVFAAMLFASIGMIINPLFFWVHMAEIWGAVLDIMLVKFVVVVLSVRVFNYPWSTTLITGEGSVTNLCVFWSLFCFCECAYARSSAFVHTYRSD
jgi:CPA2 family monovalent cation:H+ antiporter-2